MFTDTLCVFRDRFTRTLIGASEVKNGVYVYRDVSVARGHRAKASEDQILWHRRLGHLSYGVLSFLPFIYGVKDVPTKFGGCDVCFQSKQTREVFSESSNKVLVSFDLIHINLWGPYRVSSSCGAVYFCTIVHDFSMSVWIHLLLEKNEVKTVVPNFISLINRQFGKMVKTVRSDNGIDFMCLTSYFAKKGILHYISYVNTPQQNGRVERKHRHISNVARSLLFQANLPVKFWGESVLAAAHLINRTPMKVLQGKTLYECLYGKRSSYENIKTFGCLCFAHKSRRDKDKFGTRSMRCILWDTLLGRKVGSCMILKRTSFWSLAM